MNTDTPRPWTEHVPYPRKLLSREWSEPEMAGVSRLGDVELLLA
ncbi:hypothetical protein RCH07_003258 [Arthrobacter sp. CG_A4]|nr:hypothetical protein [Arthrobacter sp. CG_A4]